MKVEEVGGFVACGDFHPRPAERREKDILQECSICEAGFLEEWGGAAVVPLLLVVVEGTEVLVAILRGRKC